MLVAVAHVRSVHEDRVIQQRAVAVFGRGHLLQEIGEALHVPSLDLRNLGNPLRLIGVVRNGMERIGHTHVVVGLVRAFSRHQVRGDASNIRLVGDREQIEHEINLLVEFVVHTDGAFGNLHAGDIGGRNNARPSFDFAHALQVLLHPCAIRGSQLRLECLRAVQNHVEQAVGFACVQDALLWRRCPEQLVENLLRVVFRGKSGVGVAERQERRCGTGAGRLLVVCFRGQLQGRHRRFLTDLLGNELIDRRGVLLAVQPRARIPRVHARAVEVLEIPDRRHIFLKGLQRRSDLVQLEVRALSFRCPQIALRPKLGVVLNGAVGNVEEARANLRGGCCLCQCCCRRYHGIQERQRQRHSSAFERCSSGNMFLENKHGEYLLYLVATFVPAAFGAGAGPCLRNASERTIP